MLPYFYMFYKVIFADLLCESTPSGGTILEDVVKRPDAACCAYGIITANDIF